jgi:DNA-directed RNA polymerase specialized sigma24 family protein
MLLQPNGEIDWDRVYKRLCVFAAAFTSFVPRIVDGVSLMDLPSETILTFLESEDALGWDSCKGDLASFLCGVLKHKLLDHHRRQKFTAGSLDDEHFLQHLVDPTIIPEELSDTAATIEFLKHRVGGDTELQAFLEAADSYDGGNDVNKQIATTLGITPQGVVIIRKKLLRRIRRDMILTRKTSPQ